MREHLREALARAHNERHPLLLGETDLNDWEMLSDHGKARHYAEADAVLDTIVAEAQRQGATHLTLPDLTGVVAVDECRRRFDDGAPYIFRPLPEDDK